MKEVVNQAAGRLGAKNELRGTGAVEGVRYNEAKGKGGELRQWW